MKHKFTFRLKKAGMAMFALLTMVLSLAALESQGQMTWDFTNAGATGRSGPTQAQVNSAYAGSLLENNVTVSPQGIQKWTVPASGLYLIEAEGAQGGNSGAVSGGLGAAISGELYLIARDVLSIGVGQQGLGDATSGAAGGGGGSFVTLGADHLTSTPLVIAGGGSGTGGNSNGKDAQTGTLSGAGDDCLSGTDNGEGGNSAETCNWGAGGAGGFLTDGAGESGWTGQRGYAFRNGAMGGTSGSGNRVGGFGGGAGTHANNTGGGAGGGYSGGSAPSHGGAFNGGGGSSFNAGENPEFTAGVGTGHGSVSVTKLYFIAEVELNPASCPETSDGSIIAKAQGGVAPYTFEWSTGATAASGQAIDGFNLLGHFDDHSYYRGVSQFASYDAANTAAAAHHGSLVIVNSAEENAWLLANGAQLGDMIGGSDSETEGTWIWPNGEPFSAGYTNWNTGEPNNSGGNEDYVTIVSGGLWNDIQWNFNGTTRQIFELEPISQIENLAPGDYTLTVTDAEGAVISKTFTVGPDVLEVSFDMTQATSCNEISDGAAEAIVSGGTAPYTFSWDSGEDVAAISDKGIGSYTVTVTDANGCDPAIETVEITPVDDTAPTAAVMDIDVYLDADGLATIAAEDVDNGSADDCALAQIAIDITDFTCEDMGENTVTLTATDVAGNSHQAQAIVSVTDTIAPIAMARNLTVELDVNGAASIIADQVNNGSTDNCGIDQISLDKTAFNCADLGANDVVLTVADMSGNQKAVTAQVQVVDNIAPSLMVQNIEVTLDADGFASITTGDVEVSSADNCAVASKALNISNFSCEDLGEVTVEMTVADASGNERTESLTVTVRDQIAPVANPQAHTIELDADGLAELTSAQVKQFIGGADTDNCSGILDGSHALSLMQFTCEDLGENTLTYSVQDISGNEGAAPVMITVVDNVAPQALARNIVVELDQDGLATIDALDADNGSTDNCSVASRTLSITEFSCEDLGEQEVTLTVADPSGNESAATFTVSVVDQVAPVIAATVSATVYLDENGAAAFDSAPIMAQATDNCGLDAIVVQQGEGYEDINGSPFSCQEVGFNQGPLFVRDNSGNLTGFTLELTVLDTIKPSLELEMIVLQSDAEGNAFLTEEMLLPFAADNCGIAEVAIQTDEFDCSAAGEMQYTEIVVFDLNGNARQQTLGVQIEDNIAPQVEVANIVIALDADGQAVLDIEMTEAIITENCAVNQQILSQTEYSCLDLGENINTLSVSDFGGNIGEAVFTVTVIDNTAPTINGPQVLTMCEGTEVSYAAFSAADNCSATLTVADGLQEGVMPAAGEYMVEFEAVDPSGNVTTHVAMLDVKAPAEVDLGEDMTVAAGTEVTLTAGDKDVNTYLWNNGETGPVYQFTATEDVVISVEVTTADGCVTYDEIAITINGALSTTEDSDGNGVHFFPNPTRDQLSVQFSLNSMSEDIILSVFDLSGKKLTERVIPAAQNGDVFSLDLSGFASGVYLINVMSDDFSLTEQVVKQ